MDLTILRDALLVTLVLMLVYVLYKRLIKVLSREHVQALYKVTVLDLASTADDRYELRILAEQEVELAITIHQADGAFVEEAYKGIFGKGEHVVSASRNGRSAGRYYFQITTSNQSVSQYFEWK
jgi:uncharacterized membrane protein YhiD involved in acid resistance